MKNYVFPDRYQIVKIVVFGGFLITIFAVLQIIDYSIPKEIQIDGISYMDNEIIWDIESINADRNFTSIIGWAIYPDEPQINIKVDIVLENKSTNKFYQIPSQMVSREDLNDLINDDIDYSNSGFFARVNNQLINLNKEYYNIYIRYRMNEKIYYIDSGLELGIKETN